MIALLLVLAAHDPPPYNDPSVPHDCSNDFEADSLVGADVLHFQSYPVGGGWVPYLILNGVQLGPVGECGKVDNYTAAGQIGGTTSVILRTNPQTPLNDGAFGWVAWGSSYVSPPYYSSLGGWSMIGGPIVALWGLTDADRFYSSFGWVGWRRLVTWPSDPDLVGTTLFVQGWCVDGPPDLQQVARLSGTWMLTFTGQGGGA